MKPDPGLPSQRTGMAWSRTLFVMLVNDLLFLRLGIQTESLMLFAGSMLLLANVGLMAIVAIGRYRYIPTEPVLSRFHRIMVAFTALSLVLTALIFLTYQILR